MENVTKLRLKYLAKNNNISMAKVLKELGIGSGYIADIGRVGILPAADKLIKFADYFNVSVDYLLGRTDNPEINK
ncbi:MAG: helix-turn-helix domain-containing protein [Oscillospiraceae bacterium]|nr:helix-turn-helix domain-containing protein [Oscillospiraceae bacterium]